MTYRLAYNAPPPVGRGVGVTQTPPHLTFSYPPPLSSTEAPPGAAVPAGQCGRHPRLPLQAPAERRRSHGLRPSGGAGPAQRALRRRTGQPDGERGRAEGPAAQAGELRAAGGRPAGLHPEQAEGPGAGGAAGAQRGRLQADPGGKQENPFVVTFIVVHIGMSFIKRMEIIFELTEKA